MWKRNALQGRGTQAHINKLRDVVTFVFLHCTSGKQQNLYRAGQPKKLRLKQCGIKNAVPCVSFLSDWPDALAEAVQIALLRQAGRFTKIDEDKLRSNRLEIEIEPLNLKGVPRWRRKQAQKFNIQDTVIGSEPQADQVLMQNNIFRRTAMSRMRAVVRHSWKADSAMGQRAAKSMAQH